MGLYRLEIRNPIRPKTQYTDVRAKRQRSRPTTTTDYGVTAIHVSLKNPTRGINWAASRPDTDIYNIKFQLRKPLQIVVISVSIYKQSSRQF
ncbi:hypothetical protein LINPERPRIM_LOCUS40016 [Linum perenne]